MAYNTRYRIEFDQPFDRSRFLAMADVRRACQRAGTDMPNDFREFFSQPVNGFAYAAIATDPSREEINFALRADLAGHEPCKWYDHESDLRRLSGQFPELLITLHGSGEEAGDLWRKYFKAGKCQEARAKVVYDEFDPEKLT